MNLLIDEDLLSKYHLSLDEFLLLAFTFLDISMEYTKKNLEEKGLIRVSPPFEPSITSDGKGLMAEMMQEMTETIKRSCKVDFVDIARAMKELFPKGRKEGTNYMWRDSDVVIARRLEILYKRYGCTFTKEQAVDATKRYVESFQGDYTYMQLLKYFIIKTVMDKDGNTTIKSDFMSLLENEDINTNNNWTVELK